MILWDGGQGSGQRGAQRRDWDNLRVVIQGLQGAQDDDALQTVGAVGSGNVSVAEYGDGAVHKTVITLTDYELATTDGTTPATDGAWATGQVYTFPTGSKALLMAGFDLDSLEDNAGADGLTATADFDLGVGSVAVAQDSAFSLTGTLSDYAEATVALVASASTDTDTNVTPAVHTATGLHLNLRTVDDADHGTVAGLLKVSGTITILWSMVQ